MTKSEPTKVTVGELLDKTGEQAREIEKLRGMLSKPIMEFGELQELHETIANHKTLIAGLADAAALYLSFDGSDKIYDAVKLQGARVKLRAEIQIAREATR